jgi:hypothetical protein
MMRQNEVWFYLFYYFQLSDIQNLLLLAKSQKHGFGTTNRILYTQIHLVSCHAIRRPNTYEDKNEGRNAEIRVSQFDHTFREVWLRAAFFGVCFKQLQLIYFPSSRSLGQLDWNYFKEFRNISILSVQKNSEPSQYQRWVDLKYWK